MRELPLEASLFLFLVVLFSGRTNELGVVVGSAARAILLWPLYRRLAGLGLE